MILAYLDESENTGGDLSDQVQPFHFVGAVLVSEGAWLATKIAMEQIVEFAIQYGHDSVPATCELHGKEIWQGNKGWRRISTEVRPEVLSRCVSVMDREGLRIVRAGCNKRLLRDRYTHPAHPHSIALWLCLERGARVA